MTESDEVQYKGEFAAANIILTLLQLEESAIRCPGSAERVKILNSLADEYSGMCARDLGLIVKRAKASSK